MLSIKKLLKDNYTRSGALQDLGEIQARVKEGVYGENRRLRSESGELEKLAELEGLVENLPRVRLMLAFKPQEKQIKKIGEWIRENVDPQALLDIQFNKGLIAGARIVWQNRAVDFSLKQKLRQNRPQILSLCRK